MVCVFFFNFIYAVGCYSLCMEVSAVYLCYKQESAGVQVLTRFREYYPLTPLLVINDGGVDTFKTISMLFHAEYVPCSRTSCSESGVQFANSYTAIKFVERMIAATSDDDRFTLLLEDDVWIYGQVPLTDLKYDMSGGCNGTFLSLDLVSEVKKRQPDIKKAKLPYSDTAGAFLRSSFIKNMCLKGREWKTAVHDLLLAQSPISSGELLSCLVYIFNGTVGPYRGYYEPSFFSFKAKKKFGVMGGVKILAKERSLFQ